MSKASRKRRLAAQEPAATTVEGLAVALGGPQPSAEPAPAEQPAEQQPAEVQAAAEPAAAEQPAAAADRANNALQFIGKALFHKGGHVNWPKHVVANGTASEVLIKDNPGITFESYKAQGGSVSRLCYMVKKAKLVEAKVIVQPEAPAAEATPAEPAAEPTAAAAE